MNESGPARAGAEDPALQELQQAYLSGNLVAFVGAGVSAGAGLPGWKRLVELLTERAQARGAPAESVEELSGLAARGQYIDALSAARDALGGAEFGAVIERHLDDRGRAVPEVARALAALAPGLRAVLTTNLDHLLERALDGEWPALARATADIAQRRGFILKLHGTLLDRSTWVFTREDYDRAMYADPRLRGVFAALFHACPLLFVGYGLTDDDFDVLLSQVRALAEDQPPRHFALVPRESIAPNRRKRLERSGVRLIPYENPDGTHSEVGRILRGLAGATVPDALPPPAPGPAPAPRGSAPQERAAPHPEEGPFPGLEVFDEDRAAWFFGRDAEVVELTQRLGDGPSRHRRWLQLEGASGSGKSSLARAGLLPKVRKGWIAGAPGAWNVAVLRPGSAPVMNLAQALQAALTPSAPEGWTLEGVAKALGQSETALASLLRQHVPKGRGFLLVVDQLEEAFTLAGGERARTFDALLANALRDKDGPLYLVTTVRSDFLARFRELPELELLLNAEASRYYVKPMGLPGLRAAIEGPAEQVGARFSPGLPERILEDASNSEGALPLVAHVMRALWAGRQGSTLTLEAYDALGGVSGALARSADALLEGLGEDGREQARRLLLRLVVLGQRGGANTRRTLTRAEALEAAGGGREAEAVLARLSGGRDPDRPSGSEAPARLVVVNRTEAEDRVDLVHEALLRRWSTLRTWINAGRKALERRDDLEAAAKAWVASGSRQEDLPLGTLAYFREVEGASEQARRYLDAARRRRRRALGATALLIAVVLGLVVATAAQRMRTRERESRLDHARSLAANARAMLGADPALSYALLVEAHRLQGGDPVVVEAIREWSTSGARAVLHPASSPLGAFTSDGRNLTTLSADGTTQAWTTGSKLPRAPAREGASSLLAAAFSPDGRRAITVDDTGIAHLRDLATPRELATLTGPSKLLRAAFSPEGQQVVTADEDGMARVWDAESGRSVGAVRGATRAHLSVALGPGGRKLATASDDGTVRLWEVLSGSPSRLAADLRGKVEVAFSPDGRQLAAGDEDGALWLWELEPGGAPRQPGRLLANGEHSAVVLVVFSPDGKRVAAGTENGELRVWDLGHEVADEPLGLHGHTLRITAASFSQDGRWLLTSSQRDGTVRLWDVAPGEATVELRTPPEAASPALASSPDGRWIATAPPDGPVQLCDTSGPGALKTCQVLAGHSAPVGAAAFSPDGRRLATASDDGTARLWEVPSGKPLAVLQGHSGKVNAVAFSPDGRHLLTASDDLTARLWDSAPVGVRAVLPHLAEVDTVAFSPDGQLVLTASRDDTARVWDAGLGTPVAVLRERSHIARAAFSPDRKHVALVSEGMTRIHECRVCAPVGELLARGEGGGRPLTATERNLYLHEGLPGGPAQ